MQRVFVLDTNKQVLMPCHPAKARKLLSNGKAAVFKRYPFTIILKEAIDDPVLQPIELKLDPGSKTTGIALVVDFKNGKEVVWAANLQHRGQQIKNNLDSRRNVRRNRRGRNTRYRQAKSNRAKPKGWIAPSLKSRVDNVFSWADRLINLTHITSIEVETVRFDTQLMVNPEITGIEYQQGVLTGYEVREYLLEKWGRKCAYCGLENTPLEIEHIIPKSRGGSNRISNLTLACRKCNQEKNTKTATEFGYPNIQTQAKKSLRDAAAMNTIRYVTGNRLKEFGFPVTFWTGGRTKFNRVNQGYSKDHWIDAACVGESGKDVYISDKLQPLMIKAVGHGSRQMCLMNKYGFPRTKAKQFKRVHGFQTGDMVKAIVTKGKQIGTHFGKVAIRASGSFRVGVVDGISWKYCSLVQRADGYEYSMGLLP